MLLTSIINKSTIGSMKKHITELPLGTILRVAQEATGEAAVNAVKAGRTVTGWKDGKLVKYGIGALPLSQETCDKESSNVRIA